MRNLIERTLPSLAGAAEDFLDPGSWRFGFNIQRTVLF